MSIMLHLHRNSQSLCQLPQPWVAAGLAESIWVSVQDSPHAEHLPTILQCPCSWIIHWAWCTTPKPLASQWWYYSESYQEQQQLGWKQLYYRRIVTAWAHGLTASHSTIKGIVFYSRLLLLIWQAVLAQWKIQNQHLHPQNSKAKDHTQLNA